MTPTPDQEFAHPTTKATLVRDGIRNWQAETGDTRLVTVATQEETPELFAAKLREEVQEFVENPSAEEAADIIEVLECFCKAVGISPVEIFHQQNMKRLERGSFNKRLVLHGREGK